MLNKKRDPMESKNSMGKALLVEADRQRKPPSGGRRESAVKLGAAEFPQGGFIPPEDAQ